MPTKAKTKASQKATSSAKKVELKQKNKKSKETTDDEDGKVQVNPDIPRDAVNEKKAKQNKSKSEVKKSLSASQIKDFVEEFLKKGHGSLEDDAETITSEVDLTKSEDKLILEIYETFPLFLCHDGYFFINCVFTKEAWEKIHA